MGLLDDLDRRREQEGQHSENSARLAQAYATFTTNGQGTTQYEHRVNFGLTFIEEPVVSYGSMVDIDFLADALAVEDSDDVKLPLCSGFVVNWDRDERDFYIGCWVAARVYYPPEDLVAFEAQPEVDHHFTFAAVAMKDIPFDSTDAVSD